MRRGGTHRRLLKQTQERSLASLEVTDLGRVAGFDWNRPGGRPLQKTNKEPNKKHAEELGGDGGVVVGRVVAVGVEGGLDDFGGDGALAANTPMVAAKFDDGGRHEGLSFSRVEDERDAIAELAKDFVATGAGGRARNVGAGAGERDADFLDESTDDFTSGPTQGDAASVAGNFQRETHGSVENDGERAGPESLGETIEIVGKIASENVRVVNGVDEQRKSFGFGASFDAEDFVDGGEVDGIGRKSVERVGGNRDHRAAIEPTSRVTDEARIRRIRAEL
jgi:hypothetical protein